MKIYLLLPYPLREAPSQRFRFEQYFVFLHERNMQFIVFPFLDVKTWNILYQPGHYAAKIFGILSGFLKRFLLLFHMGDADFVFIHREASPIGPPVFEWLIAKVLRKKIIYDFDDAIWLPNTSESNKIISGIKWHGKVAAICRWAYKVSCGNDYLCDYARQYNNNVVLNPTTVDTRNLHNQIKNQNTEKVTIGWTGTHSTLNYLEPLLPVIARLEKELDFRFIIISNRQPHYPLKSLQYIPWNKATEIDDLLQLNIGIMPLTDDKWAQGKCGFKALQYMALGIPAVLSPVGVNNKIVTQAKDGFLCNTETEWTAALHQLLTDPHLRIETGRQARLKIENHFSVNANRNNFLGLFQ
jgi:glycosyltransferase involved in cell wall biosynthesis